MAKSQWYVIHTYSGYENKVATSIQTIVELRGLQDLICDVKVPMFSQEDIKENGEVVTTEHKLFPGYVLVNMIVNDDTWILVRNIRGVTGFVGPDGSPIPLTEAEVQSLNIAKEEQKAPFAPGDMVKVCSGPMANFTGEVDEVDMSAGKVRVSISMGGRTIPTEMNIDQVKLV